MMRGEREADSLRDQLESALGDDVELTSVPWAQEGPRDEWIVTAWLDGEAIVDVFGVRDRYLVRKVGRGASLGSGYTVDEVAAVVRLELDRQEAARA